MLPSVNVHELCLMFDASDDDRVVLGRLPRPNDDPPAAHAPVAVEVLMEPVDEILYLRRQGVTGPTERSVFRGHSFFLC